MVIDTFCYFSFREHEERMIFKARRRNGMKHFIQTSSPLYNTLIVKHLFVNIPSQKFPYNEMRKTITVIAFSFIRFHFSFRMHHKVPHSPKPFTNRQKCLEKEKQIRPLLLYCNKAAFSKDDIVGKVTNSLFLLLVNNVNGILLKILILFC